MTAHMVSNHLYAARRRFRLAINRLGERVEIRRPDGTATENKYGKVEDKNYAVVAEEFAIRIDRDREEEAHERVVDGGVFDTDQPRILFPLDADIREDDRVAFTASVENAVPVYEILDEVTGRQAFSEYRSTLVNE